MLSRISFKNNSIIKDDKTEIKTKPKQIDKQSSLNKEEDKLIIENKKNIVATNSIDTNKKRTNILNQAINSFAHAQKTYVTIKEGLFGTIAAVSTGLATGAAVLSLDWYITRLSGHGDKSQSLFKTPAKTVGKAFYGVGKKLFSVWNMTIKDIVKYPFVGFPKDISKYVKDAKGISKYGKGISIGLGIAASCVSASFSLIKINKARAEVDHGFRIGHNR